MNDSVHGKLIPSKERTFSITAFLMIEIDAFAVMYSGSEDRKKL